MGTPESAAERASPWWAGAALAWSFLTTLPAPPVETTPGGLTLAIGLFPAVGALLGALLGGLGLALDRVLPPGPVAALLLASSALATGGLHLDGLMDCADGVFGGRSIERRLEIMRDSRVGSFGVLAGVCALLGQYACLSQMSGLPRLVALVIALGMSHWTMAAAIVAFPPARTAGLGATFHQAGRRWSLAVATILALIVAGGIGPLGLAGFAAGVLVALLGGRFLATRLGGLTGDTYGALAVVVETLVLYLSVAVHVA